SAHYGLALNVRFPVDVEECLVMPVIQPWNSYGAAGTSAEIVLVSRRPQQVTVAAVGERNTYVQVLVGEVVVQAAVILVGAAAHGEVKHAAANLPVLGGEVTGLHRYFLHRLYRYLRLVRTPR